MLSVEEALARVCAAFRPLPPETVSVSQALGRVLAEELRARVDQPPLSVSAMDGYAVRATDIEKVPISLEVVGRIAAGQAPDRTIASGQAMRIFTGAPLPEGADAIVIQEDTEAEGERRVRILESAKEGRYVRSAGLDFKRGDVGLEAGMRLTARDVGLAAAMNHAWAQVYRRPRVAILSTGDELALPGTQLEPAQIVNSNAYALAAFVEAQGGVPINLGIARDNRESLSRLALGAQGADLLLTSGGASVGDHDLVQDVLRDQGLSVDFWKIAMRPGKPLIFGHLGATPLIGLPGNPVSGLVCATLFVRPALALMQGLDPDVEPKQTAIVGCDLPENDSRQDYLRATLSRSTTDSLVAMPFPRQDSSMLLTLARADCLIVRPPKAPRLESGTRVPIIPLAGAALSI